MREKLIFGAALLFAFGIHAALIEYSYTGKATHTGAGHLETHTFSGIMIYDTGTSNVTFVDWRSEKMKIVDTVTDARSTTIVKTYHVNTDTNLHFTTVTGLKSKTYTVIAGSASGTDTNGFYHLDDYMISGENDTLPIAANTTYVFPRRFTGSNNRSLSPDVNGQEWLETWGETMTYSASRTKADNNENSTSGDVVTVLVTGLKNKGYLER
jgi:hypothetical protein